MDGWRERGRRGREREMQLIFTELTDGVGRAL